MVQLLVQVDDRLARDLNRAVPAKSRLRSEFIRRAIRKALMELDDQTTAERYRAAPSTTADEQQDPPWLPWDRKRGKRRT